jgi:hypothetical protein
MSNFETLLAHLEHHHLKDWLIEGAKREDARTIREAIKRIPDRRLNRRMAWLLSKDQD